MGVRFEVQLATVPNIMIVTLRIFPPSISEYTISVTVA